MSSKPRVLLLGASGQVGGELARHFSDMDLLIPDRAAADLSRPESLRLLVRQARPDVILNAAAYTAVDRAESEPELADSINHLAPAVLAEEAERTGALLLHYSTDYVFDGSKIAPWLETDMPAPLSVYGASKLAGERAIAERCRRFIILRTSWVYGENGHNFLKTMLQLGQKRPLLRVVDDQRGAPTTACAIAAATREIVSCLQADAAGNWSGIYHATCAGETTWYGFAKAIFAQASKSDNRIWPTVEPIATEQFPTPAKRPKNSVLSNGKLYRQFGVQLPAWERSLLRTFENIQIEAYLHG